MCCLTSPQATLSMEGAVEVKSPDIAVFSSVNLADKTRSLDSTLSLLIFLSMKLHLKFYFYFFNF